MLWAFDILLDLLDLDDNRYSGVFGVPDYEYKLINKKFRMAIWWMKMQELLDCDDIWYSGFFWGR